SNPVSISPVTSPATVTRAEDTRWMTARIQFSKNPKAPNLQITKNVQIPILKFGLRRFFGVWTFGVWDFRCSSEHRYMWLGFRLVIPSGQPEAEEFQELAPVAGDIGFGSEVFGRYLRPDFADGGLHFGAHLEIVDAHAAGLVELRRVAI